MTNQVSIQFDKKEGRIRRDAGMDRVLTKANVKTNFEFEEKALEFLKGYCEINPKFMVEDVRYASQGFVPKTDSARAWGPIIVKALKAGWIYKVKGEIEPVRNVKAHRANAQVWRSKIVKQK